MDVEEAGFELREDDESGRSERSEPSCGGKTTSQGLLGVDEWPFSRGPEEAGEAGDVGSGSSCERSCAISGPEGGEGVTALIPGVL